MNKDIEMLRLKLVIRQAKLQYALERVAKAVEVDALIVELAEAALLAQQVKSVSEEVRLAEMQESEPTSPPVSELPEPDEELPF